MRREASNGKPGDGFPRSCKRSRRAKRGWRGALALCIVLACAANAPAQQPSAPYNYHVELAQHRLVKLGYRLGTIDGRLGKQTVVALRTFQQDQELATSGRPTKETLRALEKAAPGKIHHTRLTTHGLVEYIDRGTTKCPQDHPSAMLPNRMAHGLRLRLRDDKLVLKTSFEVTPYEDSQPLLRAVKHTNTYRVAARTVDVDSIDVEAADVQAATRCYRLQMSCVPGESCITEGYATPREAFSAVFAAVSLKGPALRKVWRRLLSRLGAGKTIKPEEKTAKLPAGDTAANPEMNTRQLRE